MDIPGYNYINLILKGMHGMAKTTLQNVKYSVDET
jgi:hypothetical protein